MNSELLLTVGEFVAIMNQTLEFAYPNVTVSGEVANFKVSKNRWVYFDLKDDEATVRCFGTVYQLPGPLQDGMLLAVKGMPRLHPQYGFSLNVLSMRPTGEGSIKKAAVLLQAKLAAEGLFDPERKRPLPYPPTHVGLITSAESAAYRDFIKVLGARWGGVKITVVDVHVQGESAPAQLVEAIERCNQMTPQPEVLVVTRGGGSAEDLQAFSTESVTRAVAGSRIPTIVAIGHEVDNSLAELAADQRASTPSNAAELLVPDRRAVLASLQEYPRRLHQAATQVLTRQTSELAFARRSLQEGSERVAAATRRQLDAQQQLLDAYDPQAALQRGYAVVRTATRGSSQIIRTGQHLQLGSRLDIEISDAQVTAEVKHVTMKTGGAHGQDR